MQLLMSIREEVLKLMWPGTERRFLEIRNTDQIRRKIAVQIHALKSTTIQLDIECQDKSNRGAMVLDYLLKSQIGDLYSYHPISQKFRWCQNL